VESVANLESTGFFKVNWDVSLNKRTCFFGLGRVIRNFEGQVLSVKYSARKVEIDPTLTEAIAALHAILFCKEESFRNIIFAFTYDPRDKCSSFSSCTYWSLCRCY
jgi:hypothetical protein